MGEKMSESELRTLLAEGYRYACALRVDVHEAEDLVQESWLKLNRAYSHKPNKALLLRTIRNLHIDRYRRGKTVGMVSLDSTGANFHEHVNDDSSEQAVTNIGDPLLNRCLYRLKEEEREVLFLTVVEGYTASEVADLTEKPRGTVLSLAHRAKIKLKTYLMEEESRAQQEPVMEVNKHD